MNSRQRITVIASLLASVLYISTQLFLYSMHQDRDEIVNWRYDIHSQGNLDISLRLAASWNESLHINNGTITEDEATIRIALSHIYNKVAGQNSTRDQEYKSIVKSRKAPIVMIVCIYIRKKDILRLEKTCALLCHSNKSWLELVTPISELMKDMDTSESDIFFKFDILKSVDAILLEEFTNSLQKSLGSLGVTSLLRFESEENYGFIPCTELLEQGLVQGLKNNPIQTLQNLFQKYSHGKISLEQTTPLILFDGESWVCSWDGCYKSYRLHQLEKSDDPMDANQILLRIKIAADYLSRIIDSKGRMVYIYQAWNGEKPDDYNILRHAGSVYAILSAYNITNQESYLVSAKLAIEFYLSTCERSHRTGYYGGGIAFTSRMF
eukprot:TRINITY_DN8855_c0_g1_i7.p1 TRINITY_DN8855_c0_g1~~TRINITY_DN8855_c0_g1_i7.p1  ORF type:complete len:381 (+),score=68.42 TRINITY_DN8855_c0_g1_i7:57-1199(+)